MPHLSGVKRYVFIYFLVLFLGTGHHVMASHIIGGEINYSCLGNGLYSVTITVYRDCYTGIPPFDSPLYLSVYDHNGTFVSSSSLLVQQITPVPAFINNPCSQFPVDLCVEEGIYTTTLNLPPNNGGYHLVYQRCCRNPTILNILNPSGVGITLTTFIPTVGNVCNNNAVFQSFPPLALCALDSFYFDHSAIDQDGDSLYYTFSDPYIGATTGNPQPTVSSAPPFTAVPWAQGYSAANPIAASPVFSIDPNTGAISGTPTQIGQYVLAVSAFEYRNGVLICENRREFQFNVVSCLSGTIAELEDQSLFCQGLEVQFQNLSVVATNFFWDFGVPNIQSDTSTLENPVFVYPDTGSYTVMLIANPGWPCADTSFAMVQVYFGVEPFFIPPDTQICYTQTIDLQLLSPYNSESIISWDLGNGQVSSEAHPKDILYVQSGSYYVKVSVVQGICSGEFGDSLRIVLSECGSMVIPNVFTPNNDGTNDTWEPIYESLVEYDIYIYNRWGRLVHQYSGPVGSYLGWDGHTMGGGEAPEGTYYVVASGLSISGQVFKDSGYITLIR